MKGLTVGLMGSLLILGCSPEGGSDSGDEHAVVCLSTESPFSRIECVEPFIVDVIDELGFDFELKAATYYKFHDKNCPDGGTVQLTFKDSYLGLALVDCVDGGLNIEGSTASRKITVDWPEGKSPKYDGEQSSKLNHQIVQYSIFDDEGSVLRYVDREYETLELKVTLEDDLIDSYLEEYTTNTGSLLLEYNDTVISFTNENPIVVATTEYTDDSEDSTFPIGEWQFTDDEGNEVTLREEGGEFYLSLNGGGEFKISDDS
jgi:hypothetical protein